MASPQREARIVLQVEGVVVKFEPEVASVANNSSCTLVLSQSELRVMSPSRQSTYAVPIRCMKAIQIHQPIFSANYISGEYTVQGMDTTFTLTFSKGGATDFARAFFRLTEGHLVTNEPVADGQDTSEAVEEPSLPPRTEQEDKKNR